ncbi:MAG: hypothetical protein J6X03_00945, partial [Bacilli bacterium]|nr:hypothetical protein [Bacilli bacterium]
MKKKILLLSLLFAFSLASCEAPENNGGNGGNVTPPTNVDDTFTITWKNWNGTVLETDTNVKKGTMPTYDGATPTKAEDTENTYTFSGWTPTVTAAVADATYTATFTATPKPQTFTITWKNWNGTTLETDRNVAKGTMPSYDGATPTKQEDAQNTYTFTGWSPTVVAVTADATYTAQFRANPKPETYTITWVNWNGQVLETDTNVVRGTMPSYDGATPTKPEDENNRYTFSGWSPTVVAVTANATYTAQFSSTPKQKTYTITWANWNGSVLETDRNVPEGTIPTYDSETPERPEDEDYTYTFTGWSPDVVAAVADATYTAQFRATAKGGSEQPPEVNYFVNKKLVTTGVDTTMPGGAMAAAMFTNSFINLFTDSTFEIICIYNGQVQAILGSYLVAEDGNSAALTVSKLFDDSGYSTSIPASFTNLSITYSEGNYTFVLPDGSYTITFTLRDSGEEP